MGREISGAAAAAERLRTGAAQVDLHILLRDSKSLKIFWAGQREIAHAWPLLILTMGCRHRTLLALLQLLRDCVHELLLECA